VGRSVLPGTSRGDAGRGQSRAWAFETSPTSRLHSPRFSVSALGSQQLAVQQSGQLRRRKTTDPTAGHAHAPGVDVLTSALISWCRCLEINGPPPRLRPRFRFTSNTGQGSRGVNGGRRGAGRRQAGRDGEEHEDHEEGTREAIRSAEVEGGEEVKAGSWGGADQEESDREARDWVSNASSAFEGSW
jgi:hypothetical protein